MAESTRVQRGASGISKSSPVVRDNKNRFIKCIRAAGSSATDET